MTAELWFEIAMQCFNEESIITCLRNANFMLSEHENNFLDKMQGDL